MSAGVYYETVHGAMGEEKKTGKREQNVPTINHLARQGVEERLEGGMICAYHYPSLFQLYEIL
jgi:hypothetical protein